MSTPSPYANLVQELYIAYFGRPVDYFGLQNFDSALVSDMAPTGAADLVLAYKLDPTIKSLVDAFGASTESTQLYGAGSTQDFVNAIYEDLFDRPAATEGLSFWSQAIDSGQLSKGLAALAILAGAQQNASAQGLTDQQTIANKAAVAENFTTALGASTSYIVAYAGANAAQETRLMLATVNSTTNAASFDVQTTINDIVGGPPIHVYTLTTAPEVLVGERGFNVFNAVLDNTAGLAAGGLAQTLAASDSITGGGSGNTLNLTDFGIGGITSVPEGVTIDGVETWNIHSLEAVSGDFSNWTGLSTLNVRYSVGDEAIVAGNQATVSVGDKTGNVSVQGGTNVTVTTDTAHAVTLTSSAATYAASVGDSSNSVTVAAIDAAVTITLGAGANTVSLAPAASGTISFAAHTGADAVILGPSEGNHSVIVSISGLNNAGKDTITFSGEMSATLGGFQQVTQAEVVASGADPSLLASWVAAADGAAGSGVKGTAHGVTWFVFQGNTYLLESAAGQTTDAGTMAAGNTVVELTGTGYSFGHATGANGTLHLLG